MSRLIGLMLAVSIVWLGALVSLAPAADWPQFRGPHGSAVDPSNQSLPTEVGPGQNQLWKTSLPPGHSSPIVVGDRIFLTAVRDKKLLTISLDRETGTIQWESEASYERLETIHRIGSHAQSTPCADQECVISFFGSSGLYAHDHSGKLLWSRPMGPFLNDFGAASSPILVGNRLILCQDHDLDSFLMCLDKRSGDILWKTDRSEFLRNSCTPILWNNDGQLQVVVAATLRVVGYDLETGQEAWTVRGISRTVVSSPTVGPDGNLYLAGWAAGGDEAEPIRIEPFDDVLALKDADKNGELEESELKEGPVYQRFSQADRNKNGHLTRAEYELFRGLFDQGRNLLLSIRPGAVGEATLTHVRWRHPKLVPFCASPLFVNNTVFSVKDGGILQCLNAETGKPMKPLRLEASGNYYASPVAGDSKIYLADEQGRVTVVSAQADLQVLHTADFKEDIYATPALVDGRIYLRTGTHLYCFGVRH
ncbi:outer membrane protein assembly factor BamB family protein [Schlesneria paludicola]|uniref:outer membrane protein assembly factor BamB family protein n=1 Tax=Schlesneria paludicola TaxID=360056 RepID=UPI00029A31EF|nr:PQQ-binding-like beta-propeller repeat protein [Schlesneria paludicola]